MKRLRSACPVFPGRMAVKPGLTGWAQVNGGYDLQPPDKLVYDMEYIPQALPRAGRALPVHDGAHRAGRHGAR